jgi:hypothetical protein
MDKSNENTNRVEPLDKIVVLGVASIETKGSPLRTGETMGHQADLGISEE